MLVLIRGAGDIATGIALRLYRGGLRVVMTDLPRSTAIRRTVCFSQAIVLGETTVEGVRTRPLRRWKGWPRALCRCCPTRR